MEVKFNASQLERLAKFAEKGQPFRTALEGKYVRAIPHTDIELLKATYKEATGSEYRLHSTCGRCVFTFVELMAKAYNKSLDALAVEAEAELEAERLAYEEMEMKRKAERNAKDRARRAAKKAAARKEEGK